jgi:cell division protein ZapA (FtsZ GTPase activity inhibitor)
LGSLEQTVTITLFGQPYSFKVDSPVTQAQEVADLLIQEVARVENQQTGHGSQITKIAVLLSAALNIANENMELKRNRSELLQHVSERSAKLLRKLDEVIQ